MSRWIFFTLHFAVGFLLLWLIKQVADLALLPMDSPPSWLKALVETSYLVTGVIWGNIGWDTFKSLPEETGASLMIYVLSRTLAPVAIVLPLLIVPLDFFYRGHYMSWRVAMNWQNLVLVATAATVFVFQRLYRKSEKGFFYSAWRV